VVEVIRIEHDEKVLPFAFVVSAEVAAEWYAEKPVMLALGTTWLYPQHFPDVA